MQQVDGNAILSEFGMEQLRAGSSFGALSDPAIEAIITRGRILSLHPGETLFTPGSAGDSFYILLKGSIGYYRQGDGHLSHIRDYHFGEEIGFVSMIALTPRLGSAIASDEAMVVEVSSDLYYALHCEMPLDFGLLMMNLSRELARHFISVSGMLAERLTDEEKTAP